MAGSCGCLPATENNFRQTLQSWSFQHLTRAKHSKKGVFSFPQGIIFNQNRELLQRRFGYTSHFGGKT